MRAWFRRLVWSNATCGTAAGGNVSWHTWWSMPYDEVLPFAGGLARHFGRLNISLVRLELPIVVVRPTSHTRDALLICQVKSGFFDFNASRCLESLYDEAGAPRDEMVQASSARAASSARVASRPEYVGHDVGPYVA